MVFGHPGCMCNAFYGECFRVVRINKFFSSQNTPAQITLCFVFYGFDRLQLFENLHLVADQCFGQVVEQLLVYLVVGKSVVLDAGMNALKFPAQFRV
jgi:hypothetical protein